MGIVVKEPETQFEVAPEGLHQAVCVDIVDKGIQEGPFGAKAKIEIRWQLDVVDERLRRFEVRKWYTPSLHEKASLRKDLECWRGRKFTEEELTGFDLDQILGGNCQLQIIHTIKEGGKTYANIQAIVPAGKLPKMQPEGYEREQDRAKTEDVDDDEIPF